MKRISFLHNGITIYDYIIIKNRDDEFIIVLIDYLYNKVNAKIIIDEKGEKIFTNENDAIEFIIKIATDLIQVNYIDNVIVK